jgi:transposase
MEVDTEQNGHDKTGQEFRLMFQDESRFGRINDPKKYWAPSGIRPFTPFQVVREFTYVFAAASPKDGVMDSLVLPKVNADTMSLFLEEVARRHKDEFILMVMDKAGWHRAKRLVVPENMRLLFLPPYSPELNPVEHIWKEIRQNWFSNKFFKDMDSVEDLLVQSLSVLEKDKSRIANTTGFDWIISIILNAN